MGYGTPSQRQRQYQQKKVMTAVDTVFEYRTQRISALHENSMVTKDKRETRKRVIRYQLNAHTFKSVPLNVVSLNAAV